MRKIAKNWLAVLLAVLLIIPFSIPDVQAIATGYGKVLHDFESGLGNVGASWGNATFNILNDTDTPLIGKGSAEMQMVSFPSPSGWQGIKGPFNPAGSTQNVIGYDGWCFRLDASDITVNNNIGLYCQLVRDNVYCVSYTTGIKLFDTQGNDVTSRSSGQMDNSQTLALPSSFNGWVFVPFNITPTGGDGSLVDWANFYDFNIGISNFGYNTNINNARVYVDQISLYKSTNYPAIMNDLAPSEVRVLNNFDSDLGAVNTAWGNATIAYSHTTTSPLIGSGSLKIDCTTFPSGEWQGVNLNWDRSGGNSFNAVGYDGWCFRLDASSITANDQISLILQADHPGKPITFSDGIKLYDNSGTDVTGAGRLLGYDSFRIPGSFNGWVFVPFNSITDLGSDMSIDLSDLQYCMIGLTTWNTSSSLTGKSIYIDQFSLYKGINYKSVISEMTTGPDTFRTTSTAGGKLFNDFESTFGNYTAAGWANYTPSSITLDTTGKCVGTGSMKVTMNTSMNNAGSDNEYRWAGVVGNMPSSGGTADATNYDGIAFRLNTSEMDQPYQLGIFAGITNNSSYNYYTNNMSANIYLVDINGNLVGQHKGANIINYTDMNVPTNFNGWVFIRFDEMIGSGTLPVSALDQFYIGFSDSSTPSYSTNGFYIGGRSFYIDQICAFKGTDFADIVGVLANLTTANPEQTYTQDPNTYVSTDFNQDTNPVMHSFYVSPNGSDNNSGTLSSPFLTISKAQTAARAISGNMTGDIYINVEPGTYNFTSQMTFTSSDSGTNGYKVIYQGAKSMQTFINGGTTINGSSWVNAPEAPVSGVYKTYIGQSDVSQFYVNGTRRTRAREPADENWKTLTSWYHPLSSTNQNDPSAFWVDGVFQSPSMVIPELQAAGVNYAVEIPKTDLPEGMTYNNISEIQFVSYEDWSTERVHLTGIYSIGNSYYLALKPNEADLLFGGQAPIKRQTTYGRYYLENALEFLDQAGEWYYNNTTGYLYYKPLSGETLSSLTAVVPNGIEQFFSFQGTNTASVQNMILRNFKMMYTAWSAPDNNGLFDAQANAFTMEDTSFQKYSVWQPAAVKLYFASNITIQQNILKCLGSAGIYAENNSDNDTIVGNVVQDTSGNGIMGGEWFGSDPIYGWLSYADQMCNELVIKDNFVDKCGQDYQGACGIFVGISEGTQIEHNQISNMPWAGIQLGWTWDYQDYGMYNCTIRNNRLDNCMTLLCDGGSIYTLGMHNNSYIEGNYISNVQPSAWVPQNYPPIRGLYLDGSSQNFLLRNNYFENCIINLIVKDPSLNDSTNYSTTDTYVRDNAGISP